MPKINLLLMTMLFIIIRHFVKHFTNTFYRIDQVELNKTATEYIVTFFSRSDKRYFIKRCSDIINNSEMINKFTPIDIAKLAEATAQLKYKNMLNISI